MIPLALLIVLYPVFAARLQPGAEGTPRSNDERTPAQGQTMTKWDLCDGSMGRAQRPEALGTDHLPSITV